MKKTSLVFIAMSALMLLTTCSEPIDFLDEVSTEVKLANDLYLVVENVSPVNNSTEINPGQRLVIEFDRAVQTSSISASSIVISDGITEALWSHEYNEANNSLYIYPEPYLDGEKSYSVFITESLRGVDGSSLQGEYAWSFDTGLYPAGSVVINDGDSWTDSRNVILTISVNSEATGYKIAGTEEGLDTAVWVGIVPDSTITGVPHPFPEGDIPRTIYAKFRNVSNDETEAEFDSIEVDENPPDVSSFQLNAGDPTTPSLRPYLSFGVAEAYLLQWRQSVNDGTWSSWQNLTPGNYSGLTALRTLNETLSTPQKYSIQFRDSHGQVSDEFRSVTLEIPELDYVDKGKNGDGKINVAFEPVTSLAVSPTVYNFYTSKLDTPDDFKKNGVFVGSTMDEAGTFSFELKPGEPRFVWIQAYNEKTGGNGPVNPDAELAYSGDVTLIYNAEDETDSALARQIKDVLLMDLPVLYKSVKGVMPDYSVTLLPQEYIEDEFSEKGESTIGGDPIIVTNGTDRWDELGRTRNVVHDQRGLIAMGNGGMMMLEVIGKNYSDPWKYPDAALLVQDAARIRPEKGYTRVWYADIKDTPWNYPLLSEELGGDEPKNGSDVQLSTKEPIQYYLTRTSGPLIGEFLHSRVFGTEVDSFFFNVVQQGRFMMYGFEIFPEIPETSWVYFVNLVARMNAG